MSLEFERVMCDGFAIQIAFLVSQFKSNVYIA